MVSVTCGNGRATWVSTTMGALLLSNPKQPPLSGLPVFRAASSM